MPKEITALPQFPLLTPDELKVLHRQKIIRVIFGRGGGFGNETASLRIVYWLRSNGYKNWIEIVYERFPDKLKTLLGLPPDMPAVFKLERYKISVMPESSFESVESCSKIAYANFGFIGPTLINKCKKYKTRVFIGLSPYFWHDPEKRAFDAPLGLEGIWTRIWRLGDDQSSLGEDQPSIIQKGSETLAIREKILTLSEALLALDKIGDQLPSWLPGMVQNLQDGNFLAIPVYGISGDSRFQSALMNILMGMKQSQNVSQQFNQKPKLIWILDKPFKGMGPKKVFDEIKHILDAEEDSTQVLNPGLLPTDLRIIPFDSSASHIRETLKNITEETIVIAETGPLPMSIFSAIYTSSSLAIHEGPNSENVLLNAQLPFIRCRKGHDDLDLGQIDITKASPRLKKLLIMAHRLLCIITPSSIPDRLADFPRDLAEAIKMGSPEIFGELISESLNPDSELNRFFREISVASFKPDRIELGLRGAIEMVREHDLEVPFTDDPMDDSLYAPKREGDDAIELFGLPVVADTAEASAAALAPTVEFGADQYEFKPIDAIEFDRQTGQPIFPFDVERNGTHCGTVKLYGDSSICSSLDGTRTNVYEVKGDVPKEALDFAAAHFGEVCGALPPTTMERMVEHAKRGGMLGAVRGVGGVVEHGAKKFGATKRVAQFIGGLVTFLLYCCIGAARRSDHQRSWSGIAYNSLQEALQLMLLSLLLLSLQRTTKVVGRVATAKGYPTTGKVVDGLATILPFTFFAHGAVRDGVVSTVTSIAAGAAAEGAVMTVGRRVVDRANSH